MSTQGLQLAAGSRGAKAIAVVLLVAPPLALLDALAIAPLLVFLALLLLGSGARHQLGASLAALFDPAQRLFLALFLLWLTASAVWSPDLAFGLKTAAMTLGAVAAGLVVAGGLRRLPPAELSQALSALARGIALGLGLLLVVTIGQRWLIEPTSRWAEPALRLALRMDRGTTFAALLLWPTVVGCWRRGQRRLALALPLLAVPAIGLSYDLAAKVSLVLGLAMFLLAAVLPRRLAAVLGLAMAAALILAPLAAQRLPAPEQSLTWPGLPRSAHHRLTIWGFAGRMIAERPVAGWGLEASRRLGGGALQLTDRNGLPLEEELMPLHPHDAPLQVWLELGGVGALLLAPFILLLGRRLAAIADRPSAAAGTAVFAVACAISCVSYGFWQSWWQSSLWLAAAVVVALADSAAPAVRRV